MLDININTPYSIMEKLKIKLKHRRLFLNLTQEGLSKRSGVTLGSLKRFESSGHISLEPLLKLAVVLECLDDFKNIANPIKTINSIDEIIDAKDVQTRKRGSIK